VKGHKMAVFQALPLVLLEGTLIVLAAVACGRVMYKITKHEGLSIFLGFVLVILAIVF